MFCITIQNRETNSQHSFITEDEGSVIYLTEVLDEQKHPYIVRHVSGGNLCKPEDFTDESRYWWVENFSKTE